MKWRRVIPGWFPFGMCPLAFGRKSPPQARRPRHRTYSMSPRNEGGVKCSLLEFISHRTLFRRSPDGQSSWFSKKPEGPSGLANPSVAELPMSERMTIASLPTECLCSAVLADVLDSLGRRHQALPGEL